MDLSEARGLELFRVVRESIGITQRLSAQWGTVRLQAIGILTLEPERLKNRSTTTGERLTGDGQGSYPRRSSGLRLQFVGVEVFSFLPQRQRNGCDLACQGEAHHGRFDAFGQRALVKLPKWSRYHAGPGRRGFEQTLEIVIVIFIQTANGKLLFGAAPFAVHVDIFSGDASFQSQSAVLPQLALTAETMRGLDQCHRQSGTNRTQRGNLSQLGGDAMFATLGQKLAACLLAHVLQHVQLLIEVLSSPPRSGFADFF